ncbi:helicase [Paenibacillus senegalensis]|uniref:helicase n=1 Tax=Paenibacillus senegalensis TaxID=1465766 RepID=UPI000288AD5A|nr:helicase [Paenibacillus senegalensis]
MNVFVYGVLDNGQWYWEITFDLRADFLFWHERLQGAYQLMLLEPDLSLGQAMWLKNQLAASSRRAANATNDKWREEIQRTWESGPYSRSALPAPFKLTLIKKGRNDDIVSIGLHNHNGDKKEFQKLLDKLQGRSLLLEEWKQLQQTQGLQWSEATQRYCLQTAYLRQTIHLLPGIKRIERAAWGKSTVQYQCQRCGSSQERMHWSHCHQCRELCPYCEECLTMGRVRSCSMLIQGQASQEDKDYAHQGSMVTPELNWKKHLVAYWGLSPAQTEASLAGLRFLAQDRNKDSREHFAKRNKGAQHFLIWAVTGAGKTEMIFPLSIRTPFN